MGEEEVLWVVCGHRCLVSLLFLGYIGIGLPSDRSLSIFCGLVTSFGDFMLLDPFSQTQTLNTYGEEMNYYSW